MANPTEETPVVATAAPVSSPAPVTEAAPPANPDQANASTAPAVETVASIPAAGASTEVAPAPEAKPVETSAAEPTLLQKHDAETKAETKPPEEKPVEAKPAEAKPGEEVKAEDAKPAEVVAEPLAPVDYFATIKVPETLKIDDALKSDVTKAFDAFRADPTVGAQGLIDLHNKSMEEYSTFLQSEQRRVWNETQRRWQTDAMADPVIGGAGHKTAMAKVADVRDRLVPEAERAAFNEFLSVTGAGNHPVFLRMLHNASRYIGEPAMPPKEAKPVPNNGRSPTATRRELLYPNSTPPQT